MERAFSPLTRLLTDKVRGMGPRALTAQLQTMIHKEWVDEHAADVAKEQGIYFATLNDARFAAATEAIGKSKSRKRRRVGGGRGGRRGRGGGWGRGSVPF